jgi:hypothetical protein
MEQDNDIFGAAPEPLSQPGLSISVFVSSAWANLGGKQLM